MISCLTCWLPANALLDSAWDPCFICSGPCNLHIDAALNTDLSSATRICGMLASTRPAVDTELAKVSASGFPSLRMSRNARLLSHYIGARSGAFLFTPWREPAVGASIRHLLKRPRVQLKSCIPKRPCELDMHSPRLQVHLPTSWTYEASAGAARTAHIFFLSSCCKSRCRALFCSYSW